MGTLLKVLRTGIHDGIAVSPGAAFEAIAADGIECVTGSLGRMERVLDSPNLTPSGFYSIKKAHKRVLLPTLVASSCSLLVEVLVWGGGLFAELWIAYQASMLIQPRFESLVSVAQAFSLVFALTYFILLKPLRLVQARCYRWAGEFVARRFLAEVRQVDAHLKQAALRAS